MNIWVEALTGKQALLFSFIAKFFMDRGDNVIITCREYDYTARIFFQRGLKPYVLGRYGGGTLLGKIRASLDRQLRMLDIITEKNIDVHISFTSPDSCRVAYGLNIPIINLTDSPHSYIVNKLTIPLSRFLIIPHCIPKKEFSHLIPLRNIYTFNGIFEVTWTKNFSPDSRILDELNLDKYRYIVMRTEEKKASYYKHMDSRPTLISIFIDKLISRERGLKIVIFPRYTDQKKYLIKKYGEKIIIPERSVDTQSLAHYSLLVITGGSTFAQEAALQGIPSISYFPYHFYIEEYIAKRGFPLFHYIDIINALKKMLDIISDPFKYHINTTRLLERMESPLELLEKIINQIFIED